MLIVVNVEERYRVEITLYVDDMPIRNVRMKIDEYIPSEKRLRKMVNEFCQKFVNQKYFADPEIATHAQDLSSVTDIYGLRIWKNDRKREWD
tara:strand:- start:312 stop:587 length:276 start_codon:yes stop_codon:yes gene_type:complete